MKRMLSLLLAGLPLLLAAQPPKVGILPIEKIRTMFDAYSGGYHLEFGGYVLLDEPQAVDSVRLRVTYDLEMRCDTLCCFDRVAAEVGRHLSKFYSLYLWQYAFNATFRAQAVTCDWMTRCRVCWPEALYVDGRRRQATGRVVLPCTVDRCLEYTEPLPDIAWRLDPSDTCTVAGYPCLRAEAAFRGRHWRVCYAPDLPVTAGCWKFTGLPGMVLAAEDETGEYRLTAVAVEQPSAAIVRYACPTQRMSRQQVQRAQQRLYRHPLDAMLATYGQPYFIVLRSDGRPEVITEQDDVSIPYTPIELE